METTRFMKINLYNQFGTVRKPVTIAAMDWNWTYPLPLSRHVMTSVTK